MIGRTGFRASPSSLATQLSISRARNQSLREQNAGLRADLAAAQQQIARLEQLSEKDALTGLYNARGFRAKLLSMVDAAFRYNRGFSLALIDLDKFKKVNDHHGHQAGDLALVHVARILLNKLRLTDVAGRYGGDELVVILDQTLHGHAITPLEEIRRTVQNSPLPISGRGELSLTVSIGFVGLTPPGQEQRLPPGEVRQWKAGLLEKADVALYASKFRGRNQVTPYSDELIGYVEQQRRLAALKKTGAELPAIP